MLLGQLMVATFEYRLMKMKNRPTEITSVHSIHLQAVCSYDRKFIDIFVGYVDKEIIFCNILFESMS